MHTSVARWHVPRVAYPACAPADGHVEDDRDLAAAIATVLESESHEVRIAHHGGEGLDRIYEHRPNLILLDVQMPALDGPAMVRRLGSLEEDGRPIPIVLMSGIDGLAMIAERLETPYFLHKPFGADNLIHIVRAALRGSSTSTPQPRSSAPDGEKSSAS